MHIDKIKYFHYKDKHYALIYQNDKIEIIEDEATIKNKIKELYHFLVKNTFSTFNLLKENLIKNNLLEESEKDIIKKLTLDLDVNKNISTLKIERLSGKIEIIKENITNNYYNYLKKLVNTYNLNNKQLEKYKIKVVNKSKIRNLKIRKSLISLITLTSITLTGLGIKEKIENENKDSNLKNNEILEPVVPSLEIKRVTLKPSNVIYEDTVSLDSSNEDKKQEDLEVTKNKKTFFKKYRESLINRKNIYEVLKEKINNELLENIKNLSKEELSLSTSVLVAYKYKNNLYYVIDYEKGYKKFSIQEREKCWQYAHMYASKIFKYSNSTPLVSKTVGLTSSSTDEILNIAMQELLDGRPTVIEVNGNPGTNHRHFVTIIGIKANSDLNNLKQADFLVIDPGKGKLIELDTKLEGKLVKRSLVNAQDVSHRPIGGEDNQYCIEIYNNPDEYISDTCSITKV